MGVGIGIRSKPLSEKAVQTAIKKLLQNAVTAFGDAELDARVKTFEQGDRAWIRFSSGEEDVELFPKDGGLHCYAKTSSLGPGYHVFLVNWLKRMDQKLKLDWLWAEEDGDHGDETGYGTHGQFESVQDEMLRQLTAMAGVVLENEDSTGFKLNMSLDFPGVEGEHFAIFSMGFLSREWFERIQSGDPATKAQLASQYYPWWNRERDANFWHRMGLLQMWSHTRWNVPQTDAERTEMEFTRHCFKRARTLDAKLKLPTRELEELDALLEPDAEDRVPPPGIGFFRGNMTHTIGASWRITLPGYYHFEQQEDGAHVFWFNTRTVWATAFSFKGKNGNLPSADESLSLKEVEKESAELFSKDHLRGCSEFTPGDDGTYIQLNARMAVAGSMLMLTICVDESERDWALNVWRTAFHPDPQSE